MTQPQTITKPNNNLRQPFLLMLADYEANEPASEKIRQYARGRLDFSAYIESLMREERGENLPKEHDMQRDVKPFTVTYGDLSVEVDAPGWYCTSCDEAVFVGKDMDAAEKARLRLKAQAEDLLLPEEIRRIRKRLNLSQEDAGILIGGGPNAFHKYENGIVLPSQAISNLLRWLEVDPKGLQLFSSRQKSGGTENRKLVQRGSHKGDAVTVTAH